MGDLCHPGTVRVAPATKPRPARSPPSSRKSPAPAWCYPAPSPNAAPAAGTPAAPATPTRPAATAPTGNGPARSPRKPSAAGSPPNKTTTTKPGSTMTAGPGTPPPARSPRHHRPRNRPPLTATHPQPSTTRQLTRTSGKRPLNLWARSPNQRPSGELTPKLRTSLAHKPGRRYLTCANTVRCRLRVLRLATAETGSLRLVVPNTCPSLSRPVWARGACLAPLPLPLRRAGQPVGWREDQSLPGRHDVGMFTARSVDRQDLDVNGSRSVIVRGGGQIPSMAPSASASPQTGSLAEGGPQHPTRAPLTFMV